MSFLSKIVPSWLSATNENTVALANFKVDFTLFRIDPPAEFNPLGFALTKRRRKEAEHEDLHGTACHLGYLFEQIVPSTPKLISAYGKRVSEIIQKPGINPEGLSSHGPFQAFVGVDATAMWAAATSNIASIAVYMLACIVSRLLGPREAISLWVELVDERKKEIHRARAHNSIVTALTFQSAQQKISRDDLAAWDNSARSWVRSADEAKSSEMKQLRLILDNLNIPCCTGSTTYQKIMTLWKEALTGVESLLSGSPQMSLTKSVPLALLSWHLFPDLIILHTEIKKVSFKDPAFSRGAVLTLGSAGVSEQTSTSGGTKWSLALSHLQFYGKAIEVATNEDESRISIEQALVVTLGALMEAWEMPVRDFSSMQTIAAWFEELGRTLFGPGIHFKDSIQEFPKSLLWLQPLLEAAQNINLGGSDETRKDLSQLFQFGRRNYKFLMPEYTIGLPLLPFFGLRNSSVARGLMMGSAEECSIAYLRDVARKMGLNRNDCIILHLRNDKDAELLTALPKSQRSVKRNSDAQFKRGLGYHKWTATRQCDERDEALVPLDEDPSSEDISWYDKSIFMEPCVYTMNWKFGYRKKKVQCQKTKREDCGGLFTGRLKGMQGLVLSFETFQESDKAEENCVFTWIDPPREFVRPDYCTDRVSKKEDSVTEDFIMIVGDSRIGGTGLYVRSTLVHEISSQQKFKHEDASLEQSQAWLRDANCSTLLNYLCERRLGEDPFPEYMNHPPRFPPQNWQKSLKAIATARYLYSGWPGATLSTKVFLSNNSISKTKWAQEAKWSQETNWEQEARWSQTPNWGREAKWIQWEKKEKWAKEVSLTTNSLALLQSHSWSLSDLISRHTAFACVMYMDSGTFDIDPRALADAVAVSRENSIYVATEALADPFPSSRPSEVNLKRLVGNVGQSGISILVTPKNPLVRGVSTSYKVVEHKSYDSIRMDSFKGTSLHLHFTSWKSPFVSDTRHTIDYEVHYREAVISVLDQGEWVADLDVLRASDPEIKTFKCQCSSENPYPYPTDHLVSLDSWEEVLDAPQSEIGIFRADGNWAARLAAVCIVAQKGLLSQAIILPSEEICFECLQTALLRQPQTRFIIN